MSNDQHAVDQVLSSSLESLDNALNYRNWIVDLCTPYLGTSLLEIGAGHGTFTESFAKLCTVCAVEPGTDSSATLTERFADDENVDVIVGVADNVEKVGFDAAVMINVFEHIDDEIGTLETIHHRLQPDGHLIIWVPAFMLLYSPFDKALGHHRRYRLKPLIELIEANGFDVVERRYANLPGWFFWLICVRILRQEPSNETTVQLFDRFIVPVVRWIESRLRVPFGQSIFIVARRQP